MERGLTTHTEKGMIVAGIPCKVLPPMLVAGMMISTVCQQLLQLTFFIRQNGTRRRCGFSRVAVQARVRHPIVTSTVVARVVGQFASARIVLTTYVVLYLVLLVCCPFYLSFNDRALMLVWSHFLNFLIMLSISSAPYQIVAQRNKMSLSHGRWKDPKTKSAMVMILGSICKDSILIVCTFSSQSGSSHTQLINTTLRRQLIRYANN